MDKDRLIVKDYFKETLGRLMDIKTPDKYRSIKIPTNSSCQGVDKPFNSNVSDYL